MNNIRRYLLIPLLSLLLLFSSCAPEAYELEPLIPDSERPRIHRPILEEGAVYERAYEDSTVILTASDFQDWNDKEEIYCCDRMEKMLSKVDSGIFFDGFFFCGDVDAGTAGDAVETKKALDDLDGFISEHIYSDDRFYVKGNHDSGDISMLSSSGYNDTKDYGVFVINDGDEGSSDVEMTAQSLIDYLNEKLAEEYDKPIFVLAHSPLHFSDRTGEHGTGSTAKYIFDVLDKAGAKGLNIIFIFGHNHSGGWDDYLGGSSVFLTKGDSINISTGEENTFETYPLNFTYMNAGYVGYYIQKNEGAGNKLTMCIIEITDGAVSFSRISTNGVELLKEKGASGEEELTEANVREVESYYELVLTKVASTKPIKGILKDDSELPKEGYYRRIVKEEDIADGGKYLVVLQERDSDSRYVVMPELEAAGGMKGLSLFSAMSFEDDYMVTPRFTIREWTFTKSGRGWQLGFEDEFMSRDAENGGAILSAEGDTLTVRRNGSRYFVSNGDYNLCKNEAAPIAEFSENNPSLIYIYEYVE